METAITEHGEPRQLIQNLVEIAHSDYPDERLVCCRNPALAQERTRKRHELLAATEIALRVGKVINHYEMAKHFSMEITEDSFTFGITLPLRRSRGIALGGISFPFKAR
jgi:hypothetical protein